RVGDDAGQPALAAEALDGVAGVGELGPDELDGDAPPVGAFALVDGAHAAGAEGADQAVAADTLRRRLAAAVAARAAVVRGGLRAGVRGGGVAVGAEGAPAVGAEARRHTRVFQRRAAGRTGELLHDVRPFVSPRAAPGIGTRMTRMGRMTADQTRTKQARAEGASGIG